MLLQRLDDLYLRVRIQSGEATWRPADRGRRPQLTNTWWGRQSSLFRAQKSYMRPKLRGLPQRSPPPHMLLRKKHMGPYPLHPWRRHTPQSALLRGRHVRICRLRLWLFSRDICRRIYCISLDSRLVSRLVPTLSSTWTTGFSIQGCSFGKADRST